MLAAYPRKSEGAGMIQSLFNQTNYVATKKLLDATVLRHEAISSNLANVETPAYKRVDVAQNFQTELSLALNSNDMTRMGMLRPTVSQDLTAISSNRDGNTVKLEQEMLEMNQNTVAHTLETQLVSGSLLKLRLAITGRA
jgi:flagellar basal-body rod protein FlgB